MYSCSLWCTALAIASDTMTEAISGERAVLNPNCISERGVGHVCSVAMDLGFIQIRIVPQSCHSGKRWIWIMDALGNTNPSKKSLQYQSCMGSPCVTDSWQLDYW